MKPDVQIYFTDPDELLKKKIKEVQQVSEFQKNHRARLMAHQKKQLKKFKTVKEDFRKLIKNLKELDGERKRLSQENDVMKKFIGMQRNYSHSNPGSAERSGKSHRSTYDNISPISNLSTVSGKYPDLQKTDKSKSHSSMAQRMCVITPPVNGKLGVIPNTPSPLSCLRKLNISSHASDQSHLKKNSPQFMTPGSSPGSVCEKYASFVSPSPPSQASNSDGFSQEFHQKNGPYKKDVRKLGGASLQS